MMSDEETFHFQISVVIATYNRGELLRLLLDDLASQSLEPHRYEVIVVDDESIEPAEQYTKKVKWPYSLQVHRQKNSGAAAARHSGIEKSQGDIIVIVDDDMSVKKDFLEQHLIAQQNGADVVLGRITQAENFASMPLHNRFQQHQFNRSFEEWCSKESLPGAVVYTGNISFKRELYYRVGGFNLDLKQSEDCELGVRFEKAGGKIVFSEDAVSINGSDHTDFEKWLETSRRYGVHDWNISRMHSDVESADPFHFLFLVNPISRPILSSVLLVPQFAPYLSRIVMSVSELADKFQLEKIALSGTTLAYGVQYYKGVRDEAGSLSAVISGWRQYITKRRQKKL